MARFPEEWLVECNNSRFLCISAKFERKVIVDSIHDMTVGSAPIIGGKTILVSFLVIIH